MNDFIAFLKDSPTVYHAAAAIARRLLAAGFVQLHEEKTWALEADKSYFVVRDGALVAAFRMPHKKPSSAVLLASHIDSPALKLKPNCESASHEMMQLNTEIYGAPLLHTWLDRDLAVAGRVVVMTESGKAQTKLVHLKEHPVVIPNLALHLDRSVMEKGINVHKQDHLKPICSLKGKHLADAMGHKIVSFDLFLTPTEPPALIGFDQEMLSAYRLDNLTSAYAACQAMCRAKARQDVLQMAIFWDHEEIGSQSHLGADSCFADQILTRIAPEDVFCLKRKSLCISGDLAHGFHPNFAEKYDPQNAPFLGKGVVIKYNANQKYATSSITAAKLLMLAEEANIPIQKFASRSDLPCGSTVGSIMAANTEIATIDLGIAGLAMHSIRETIAVQDEISLCALLSAALDKELASIEESHAHAF